MPGLAAPIDGYLKPSDTLPRVSGLIFPTHGSSLSSPEQQNNTSKAGDRNVIIDAHCYHAWKPLAVSGRPFPIRKLRVALSSSFITKWIRTALTRP